MAAEKPQLDQQNVTNQTVVNLAAEQMRMQQEIAEILSLTPSDSRGTFKTS